MGSHARLLDGPRVQLGLLEGAPTATCWRPSLTTSETHKPVKTKSPNVSLALLPIRWRCSNCLTSSGVHEWWPPVARGVGYFTSRTKLRTTPAMALSPKCLNINNLQNSTNRRCCF